MGPLSFDIWLGFIQGLVSRVEGFEHMVSSLGLDNLGFLGLKVLGLKR